MRGAFLALLLFAACSSTRTLHEAPFVPGTPLDQVHSVRELMRVRATHGDRSQSFKAQLLLEPATKRVQLTAYTPLGTSAMTLFADGDRVTFLNHIDQTQWEGSAREVALFGGIEPAAWAVTIVTTPPDANGRVIIARGGDTLEITPLEMVSTDAAPRAPSIPREYRCCVAPAL
jgi:hypothetical protein